MVDYTICRESIMDVENDIMDTICSDLKEKVDSLLSDAVEEIVFSVFECLPDIKDLRNRIAIGYGPGREKGVLFHNVVFVDRIPIAEVVVFKDISCLGSKFIVKKRLIDLENCDMYLDE
jgi:hypothetical protein